MDLSHLRPELREAEMLPKAERLALRPAHRWIGYGCAAQALARLEEMLACEPGRLRPRCLLVVGPTNNGKTAIAARFLRDHPSRASADGEHEVIPVLLVGMPPAPTVNRLYQPVEKAVGQPSGSGAMLTAMDAV